jgi:hypothetical protein
MPHGLTIHPLQSLLLLLERTDPYPYLSTSGTPFFSSLWSKRFPWIRRNGRIRWLFTQTDMIQQQEVRSHTGTTAKTKTDGDLTQTVATISEGTRNAFTASGRS